MRRQQIKDNMKRIDLSFKNETERTISEQLGAIAYLNCLVCRESLEPQKVHGRLFPALRLGQVKVIYNQTRHQPVGYLTWAFLAPDVERRLLADPAAELHVSEWNEGDRVWIMDFVAPDYCTELVHHIKEEMFADHSAIHWLPRRNRNAGRPRVWLRKSSLTSRPRKSLLIL